MEIEPYIKQLLTNYQYYFSKDLVLNSEGRKLLNIIARIVMSKCKELSSTIKKLRKNPTLDNVLKLVDRALGSSEYIMHLFSEPEDST